MNNLNNPKCSTLNGSTDRIHKSIEQQRGKIVKEMRERKKEGRKKEREGGKKKRKE